MSYAPLVHPGEIASQANPFARSPAINSLFNRCYGSDILPSRSQFPRSFSTKTSSPTFIFPSGSGSTKSIFHPRTHPTGTSYISTSFSGAATSRTRSSACWEPSARGNRPSSTIT